MLRLAATLSALALLWNPNPPQDGVTNYVVWHSTNLSTWVKIGETNGTNFVLGDPKPGKHYFLISAEN